MNIAELRALLLGCTQGRWELDDFDGIVVNGKSLLRGWDDGSAWFMESEDAKLVIAMRNALPALLAVVEAAKTVAASYDVMNDDLDALSSALAKLEEA